MNFLSLIAALVLEQWRTVGSRNPFAVALLRYGAFLERQFNTGERRHGTIAWWLAVLPPVVATVAIYWMLDSVSFVAAWVWNVAVLYVCMGFRQFSHHATAISEAMQTGDVERARAELAAWTGHPADELSAAELARVAIERGLIDSHRYVFGVMAWFLVLPGPAGAILYRLAALLGDSWGQETAGQEGQFGRYAARAFDFVDWVPARLTAASFAIVGDFEDAVYCWRAQAVNWVSQTQGIILASGAGALGVRLGEPLHRAGGIEYRPELGVGDEPDADYMRSAVGLVWRTVVLWMVVILLLTVASWVGA